MGRRDRLESLLKMLKTDDRFQVRTLGDVAAELANSERTWQPDLVPILDQGFFDGPVRGLAYGSFPAKVQQHPTVVA